jgi:hypothetical protein
MRKNGAKEPQEERERRAETKVDGKAVNLELQ